MAVMSTQSLGRSKSDFSTARSSEQTNGRSPGEGSIHAPIRDPVVEARDPEEQVDRCAPPTQSDLIVGCDPRHGFLRDVDAGGNASRTRAAPDAATEMLMSMSAVVLGCAVQYARARAPPKACTTPRASNAAWMASTLTTRLGSATAAFIDEAGCEMGETQDRELGAAVRRRTAPAGLRARHHVVLAVHRARQHPDHAPTAVS